MSDLNKSAAVNFFIPGEERLFAYRRMYHVPRVGDRCVFADIRYEVLRIEWCMDEDATEVGVRVNVELQRITTLRKSPARKPK